MPGAPDLLPGRVFDSPVAILADAVAGAPGRVAVACGGLSLTYAEYGRCVAGFAQALRELGAGGQVVVVALRNGVEVAVTLFAVQAAGAIACPVNPDYTPRELSLVLGDARPVAVVAKPELADRLREILPDAPPPALLVLPDDAAAWLAPWRDDPGLTLDGLRPDPDSVAALQYTGGTTGVPKGVELTHRGIATNIAQREARLPTRDGDVVLCMMPLFHVFAQAMCLHLAAHCRGTLVILPRYRPDWVVEAVARHRVTLLPAGPTVFNGLLGFEGLAGADLSSLRCCYSGSAPLSVDTAERWRAATGCTIQEGYGQTEAGPVLTYNGPDAPSPPGTVGTALPGTEIQVVDVDTGTRILPAGEAGEVRARGPQVMRGYRGRAEETAQVLRDGWLYTGDIGVLDSAGVLTILDRKKDMVITGGFNVYPREVDEVLMAHPAVEEAATVGVPDSYRGEVLRSFVRLAPGAAVDGEELRAWAARHLVRYKVPLEVVALDALPKTAAAKVDKKALRGLAVGEGVG